MDILTAIGFVAAAMSGLILLYVVPYMVTRAYYDARFTSVALALSRNIKKEG
jgi:hypothetical protein